MVPVMISANSADIGFPRGHTIEKLFALFGADTAKAKVLYNGQRAFVCERRFRPAFGRFGMQRRHHFHGPAIIAGAAYSIFGIV